MTKTKSKKEQTIEVVVKYPDHQTTFNLPTNATGKEALIKACTHINIFEYWWFQLFGEDVNKNPHSLQDEKKITHQHIYMPSKGVFHFKFRVKFYPIDVISETIQTQTWKTIYRDLRAMIMSEELYCDPTTIVTISALHLQYSLSYSTNGANASDIVKQYLDQLVPKGVIERHSMLVDEWCQLIADMWKSYRKLTPTESLKDILHLIQETDMYGVRYFDIKNKKGSKLYLGVDCDGLNIYKANNKLLPEVGLSWSEIKSVQYINSKFIIKPLDKNAPEFHMYAVNLEYNQYMMRMIIGNHEMYLSRRSPTTSEEIIEYREKAKVAQVAEEQKMAQEISSRQRAMELEAKLDAIEQQAVEGGQTKELINDLKNSYETELEEMNTRMNQLQIDAENERKKNELTEEEIKQMHEQQNKFQQEIEQERKDREELMMKETQALTLAAEKAAEAERAKAELEALKKKYEEDKRLMEELAAKAEAGEAVQKRQKSEIDSKEAKKTTESILQNKTKAQIECDLRYEDIKKSGRTKHQTLRMIRSGNTATRIDKFEAL